ncbi:MAG: CPBP family intramembrane metalloprotease [Mogibacterium sp.]|nr:CPBP family intramembrane metalloprotease [Mogibacterium sp.]
MYIIEDYEAKKHNYITYARQFHSYKWYKPILTMLMFVVFYIFLSVLLLAAVFAANFLITGGDWQGFIDRYSNVSYDSLNIRDPLDTVVWLGSLSLMIPALWFARGVVRERPFSSYTSSRGGWSVWVFIKCLFIALIVCGLPTIGILYFFHAPIELNNQFAKYGLYLLIVLCPLQCIAEEYIFRGLINQTLGAWFRLPIIAVVLSSAGFAALHPYNNIGRASIFITGLCLGLTSWFGRGIEVSSALHIVNNMLAFLMDGFGIEEVSSEVDMMSLALSAAICGMYVLIIFVLSKKTDWFDRAKFDDAGSHNDEIEMKRKKKAARHAARKAKRKPEQGSSQQ